MLPVIRTDLPPLVIGHRGAQAYSYENTMASFNKALDCGVDLVECDVHMSKDGHLVVIHDEDVNRTTGGVGLVGEMTFAQLQKLDAGSGEKIPSLHELLTWIASKSKLGIAIEIKKGKKNYPEIAKKVGLEIQSLNLFDRAIVISFDAAVIQEIKALFPHLAVGLLYYSSMPPLGFPLGLPLKELFETAKRIGAEAILPPHQWIQEELVSEAHRMNLGVFTWTANRPEDIERVLKCHVDGVASDYPDRVRTAVLGQEI